MSKYYSISIKEILEGKIPYLRGQRPAMLEQALKEIPSLVPHMADECICPEYCLKFWSNYNGPFNEVLTKELKNKQINFYEKYVVSLREGKDLYPGISKEIREDILQDFGLENWDKKFG